MNKRITLACMLIASLILLSDCTTFYKARSVDNKGKNIIEPLYRYDDDKYQFVVHSSDLMWALDNVELFSDKITGKSTELGTKEFLYYDKLKEDRKNARVPFADRKFIYQVHIYATRFLNNNGILSITDKDIEGVEIYNMNDGLNAIAMVGTAGLITIGAIGAVLAIACTCPHVYTYNGETYNFNGGMFTGAVSPKLERYDYKIMPDFFPESDQYKLMIKSDDKEEQYINNMELIVVQHDKQTMAIPDQRGKIYAIKDPQLPTEIKNDDEENLAYKTAASDDDAYNFSTISKSGFSNVFATFNLEEKSKDVKLVLRINNTKWGGYIYNEFSKMFGWYHDDWVKKNQKKSREEMESNMKDQGITMVVSVKKGNEWTDIEEIDLVGDASFNTMVIPIEEKWLTSKLLEVRLQCGFMFWQLDYMAIDNTADQKLDIYYPELKLSSDENNTRLKAALRSDDKTYLEQLSINDSTFIEFDGLLTTMEMTRTLILKSKGYYIPDAKIEGKLDLSELRKFKQPAELSRYSKKLYDQFFEGFVINR